MRPEDAHTLAGVLTSLDQRVSTLANALRGLLDCETLAVETIVIPAAGVVERDWQVEYHAVSLTSQSTQPITLHSSGAGISAPTSGVGVVVLGPARCGTYNLAGRVLSIYGKPGDVVTVQIFAKPQPPAWGA